MTRLRLLFNLTLALAVVAFFVIRADPDELWQVLRQTDYRLAGLAVMLNIPVVLLAPLRSSLVFRRLGYRVPANVLIPTTVLGFVAGGLTPAASGELLRAGALRSRAGVPLHATVATVVFERALSLYLIALSALVLFALPRLDRPLAVVVAVFGVALALLPWPVAVLSRRFIGDAGEASEAGSMVKSLWRRLVAMGLQIRGLLETPRLLIEWSGVTVAMFAVIAAQYWLLARGVAGGVSYDEAWVALGISTVAAVVSLIPLGAGVLDASLAASLHRFGLTFEQGGAVAVLVRGTVTLPLVFGAFACYLFLQRTVHDENPAPTDVA